RGRFILLFRAVRRCPGEDSVVVLSHLPAVLVMNLMMLERVVQNTQKAEVIGRGRATVCPLDGVVDLCAGDGCNATGKAAVLIPLVNESLLSRTRRIPVNGEHSSALRMDDGFVPSRRIEREETRDFVANGPIAR